MIHTYTLWVYFGWKEPIEFNLVCVDIFVLRKVFFYNYYLIIACKDIYAKRLLSTSVLIVVLKAYKNALFLFEIKSTVTVLHTFPLSQINLSYAHSSYYWALNRLTQTLWYQS